MINTFERREKKILVDEAIFPEIEKKLLEHFDYDKYNINGAPYEIVNIYFDNENFDMIRHSASKPKFKQKIRLRSYGTPTLDTNVFFEIKQKTMKVGTKRRAIMPLSDVYRFLSDGTIPDDADYINRQVLREIAYIKDLYGIKPAVYVGYMRTAYFDRTDPSLRLTVDRDIVTRRDDLRIENGRYGSPLLPEGKLLMEIKFSGSVPIWFAHIMSEYGLSFEGYSKVGREFKGSLIKRKEYVK